MSNVLPLPEPERCEAEAAQRAEIVTWPAREADLGGGLCVVRALPLRQHRLVGPWCFFDSCGPLSFTDRKAKDVAPHWAASHRFGAVKAYRGERLAAPELVGRPRASRQGAIQT